MNQFDPSQSSIEVIPATNEQKPILANLLELYSHDFCDFLELDLQPDGRFGYRQLDLYWSEAGRHPFLVTVNGKLAGFVLVKSVPGASVDEAVWDMAEFFIRRGYRRRGIGTDVAHHVWRKFPGRWQVRVMAENVRAHRFWDDAVATFTSEVIRSTQVNEGGDLWRMFSFRSSQPAQSSVCTADETA